MDPEKTGGLNIDNLREIAHSLGEHVTEEELEQMIQCADLNNDGIVNAD